MAKSTGQATADSEPSNAIEGLARRMVQKPQSVYQVLFYVVTGFFLLMSLFPFYWLMVLSLTPQNSISGMGAFLPNGFNPGVYLTVFETVPFHLFIFNSVLIAALTTVVVLLIGSIGGYVFGRYEFPGRTPLMLGVLVISYFPPAAFLIPLFQLFTANVDLFGIAFEYPQIYNTPGAVVLPLSALIMPLVIFILATFYGQIPDGLEDAARIEGSTRVGALFKVIMPLSAPGVATAGILTFIITYNEFFFSFLMLEGNPQDWGVLLHGVFRFQGTRSQAYNLMAAASIVGVVPMAALVALAQDKIVSGLTQGALKE
ncbi:carbohydrate ABC transporter permease [Halosimplex litoreum]|uniref:Carbohydrate ABC transporter permease n=1 Tax=Halosimplex litoreum TaxID=1198301 RepID=A0A7T3FWM3_9EURY|nr:carbohydrate ABC transporter permease [Halosimplex litoreum]